VIHFTLLATMILILINISSALAGGGLDSFMNDLNIQARADMKGFSAKVSAQFGVPLPLVKIFYS